MPLNIDWQQILLHLFNFVILFAVMYILLYSPVKKFMDKRVEYYKDLDNKANEKLENSDKLVKEYEAKIKNADNEVALMKENARKDMEKASDLKKEQAEEEAKKIVLDARNSLKQERKKMLAEAQNEISDMVAKAATKIVMEKSTSESYDNFLNAAKGSKIDE